MLAKNSLPTSHETKGGVLAQGVGSVISSMFNMVPVISGSANIGLCGLSGVTSRYVTAIAGGVVGLCGLCPQTLRCILLHSLRCSGRRGPLRFRYHPGFRYECHP